MEFKTAVPAEILRTVPVTFVDVTTGRTLLRGIPGIYGDNLLTYIFGFIPDKLFQFIERPVVQFPVELGSTSFLHADFRQIFECEHGIRELNNMLRDTMVSISHKPSFSTRQLPQFAGAGSSAFGLEFGSEMGAFATDILYSRRIKKCVVGTDSDVDNPPVNSKNRLFRDYLWRIGFKLTMQVEPIGVLAKGQGRGLDFPRQVSPVIFRDVEHDLNPTIRSRKGCIFGLKTYPNNSGVVSHCRILLTERFEMALHRFQRFTSNISCTLNKRGREIRNRLSNISVSSIMAINLTDRMGIKPPSRADVKSHGVISHGFQERFSTIRRNIKFQLDCPNHNHMLTVLGNILNGGDWCGAIHPMVKTTGFLAPRS